MMIYLLQIPIQLLSIRIKLNILLRKLYLLYFLGIDYSMKKKGGGLLLSISSFFLAMISLYLMAVIGFFARKINMLNNHANHVMTKLMLYVTLPAIILISLHTNFSIKLLIDF